VKSRELVALQCKRYLPEFNITSGMCDEEWQDAVGSA